MIAHALDDVPNEACGLLAAAPGTDLAEVVYRCRNAAESARVYTLHPQDHLRAERDAEANGWEIVGVVHSHTHSEPYPSPTDIAQAPVPDWQYVIVSLKRESPEIRTFRIVDGDVAEDSIAVA